MGRHYLDRIVARVGTSYLTPLTDKRIDSGIRAGRLGDFHFADRFVFYFADPNLIHLGDQLFHQALINYLQPHYDLSIAAQPAFSRYFESQGLKMISPKDCASIRGAIIISKEDTAFQISRLFPSGNYFMGFGYGAMANDARVVVALTQLVAGMAADIGITLPPVPDEASDIYQPYIPSSCLAEYGRPDWIDAIENMPYDRVLAFNDVARSNILSAYKRKSILENQARELKAQGYGIVYIGSKEDRKNSPCAPDFVDVDVRGSFDALGLYKLFSLSKVAGVITYDTLVMHVASALKKDLYIVIKDLENLDAFRRKFIPMFPQADHLVRAVF